MSTTEPRGLYSRIYTLVGQIPAGYVSCYGQVGREAGCTGRAVGFALAALPADHDVPWHRVVNSKGLISSRADGGGSVLQRVLLEREGVSFDRNQAIDLHLYGWHFSVG